MTVYLVVAHYGSWEDAYHDAIGVFTTKLLAEEAEKNYQQQIIMHLAGAPPKKRGADGLYLDDYSDWRYSNPATETAIEFKSISIEELELDKEPTL